MLALSPLGLKQFLKIVAIFHRFSKCIKLALLPNTTLLLSAVSESKLSCLQMSFSSTFFLSRDSNFSTPFELVIDSKHFLSALKTSTLIPVDKCLIQVDSSLSLSFFCAYGVVTKKFVPSMDYSMPVVAGSQSFLSISLSVATLNHVLSFFSDLSQALKLHLPLTTSGPVVLSSLDLISNTITTSISLPVSVVTVATASSATLVEYTQPLSDLKLVASVLTEDGALMSAAFGASDVIWNGKVGLDVDVCLRLPLANGLESQHPLSQMDFQGFQNTPSVLAASQDFSVEAMALNSASEEIIPGTPSQHGLAADSMRDLFETLW